MGEANNKWREPDEHPIVGKFHVRHTIPDASQTGYLFGKNFDTLFEAVEFAERQIYIPKLLVYAGEDLWLKFEPPFSFDYYYVPGSDDDAPTHRAFMGPLADWARSLNDQPASTEKLAELVRICAAIAQRQPVEAGQLMSESA